MVRKQVYLRLDQDRQLKKLARADQRTEAELIRPAVDDYMKAKQRQVSWREEKKFIERWIKDAALHAPARSGRGWRREDAYDRKILSGY